tara:strand:+ start:60 stop:275 length:216 start_codon:yes stop_codon:yes gene_type:complete
MEKELPTTIKINDNDYNISDLSENAKSQLLGMQVAINELKQLDAKKALAETAKNAYISALQNDLPEPVTKD